MLEVTYTTTLDDYVTFSLYVMKKSTWQRAQFWIMWVGVPLFAILWGSQYVSHPFPAVILAIVTLLYAILFPFLYRAWYGFIVRSHVNDLDARGVIGRITLVLNEDMLIERTVTVQSVARWQDMKGVDVVGECTYIFVTGLLAAIIPRHGFERDEDYEAVRDFALKKLNT